MLSNRYGRFLVLSLRVFQTDSSLKKLYKESHTIHVFCYHKDFHIDITIFVFRGRFSQKLKGYMYERKMSVFIP